MLRSLICAPELDQRVSDITIDVNQNILTGKFSDDRWDES
jgi:hypothetical protein